MIAIILSLLLGGFEPPQTVSKQKDQDKLAGFWKVTKTEREQNRKDRVVGLVFNGEQVTIRYAGAEQFDATCTLKTDTSPKQIDIRPRMGPQQEKTLYGIYELKDGQLKICWSEAKDQRPKSFPATAKAGTTLLVLKSSVP